MPFEVKLEKPFAGFAVEAALPGQQMLIQIGGFHTSSEGEPFIRILEGLSAHVLPADSMLPSAVHHFLIVAAPDGKLTVYVNELEIRSRIQAQHSKQAGEVVWSTDIADIVEVNIGVDIPTDQGMCLLFSVGWRKGLYFDFVLTSCSRAETARLCDGASSRSRMVCVDVSGAVRSERGPMAVATRATNVFIHWSQPKPAKTDRHSL